MELYEAECQALLDEYARSFGERLSARLTTAGDSGEEREAKSEERQLAARRFPVLGAFDLCLKCSHLFNILDARGAISVTERVGVIARIRALAVGVAKAYVDQQKAEAASVAPPCRQKKASRMEHLAASHPRSWRQRRS